jgi:hypothetical protein
MTSSQLYLNAFKYNLNPLLGLVKNIFERVRMNPATQMKTAQPVDAGQA